MEEALKIENISVSYGVNEALTGVSFTVYEGDYIGIIGPNGGGKTTLVSAILGLVNTDSGSISLFGGSVKERRHHVGYVPQVSNMDKNFPITALDAVLTSRLKDGLHPFRRFTNKEKERALKIMKRLSIDGLKDRMISELSGGEFQRILIARALASTPDMLILDEPVANVDPVSRERIYSILKEINDEGMTVIMVTHDLYAASHAVKKIAFIDKELVYFGEPRKEEKLREALTKRGYYND